MIEEKDRALMEEKEKAKREKDKEIEEAVMIQMVY